MFKHLFLIVFTAVLTLSACSQKQPEKENLPPVKTEVVPTDVPMAGADVDKHGCKASAGYQWSVLKNECIRIFETGIRLDPKATDLDKTLSAFVVFKSDTDDAQTELFLPSEQQTILLNKTGKNDAGTWKNENYTLSQWKGMYSLEDSHKKLLYQGAAAK